mgnify:CR=1 FL=1
MQMKLFPPGIRWKAYFLKAIFILTGFKRALYFLNMMKKTDELKSPFPQETGIIVREEDIISGMSSMKSTFPESII